MILYRLRPPPMSKFRLQLPIPHWGCLPHLFFDLRPFGSFKASRRQRDPQLRRQNTLYPKHVEALRTADPLAHHNTTHTPLFSTTALPIADASPPKRPPRKLPLPHHFHPLPGELQGQPRLSLSLISALPQPLNSLTQTSPTRPSAPDEPTVHTLLYARIKTKS